MAGMAQWEALRLCTPGMEVRVLLPARKPADRRALPVAGVDAPMADASQFKRDTRDRIDEACMQARTYIRSFKSPSLSMSVLVNYEEGRTARHLPSAFTV